MNVVSAEPILNISKTLQVKQRHIGLCLSWREKTQIVRRKLYTLTRDSSQLLTTILELPLVLNWHKWPGDGLVKSGLVKKQYAFTDCNIKGNWEERKNKECFLFQ